MTPPNSQTATSNATLDQFQNAGQPNSPSQNSVSPGTTSDTPSYIDPDTLNTPALEGLVSEFPREDIEQLVLSLRDTTSILKAVENATSNDTLANNIEAVNQFSTSRPSLVRTAGDKIEKTLGMRPFDLSLTEPDNDFQDPMVSLDVEDDIAFVKNPEINSELLNHATRIKGSTKSGQNRLFNDWADILGTEPLVEFKRDRHPDALGFAVPSHIPTTGDSATRTAVTEIPYIGEARADEMLPVDGLLSLEDLKGLTSKQRAWIEFPVDGSDYDNRRVRGIAEGIVELAPDDATDMLGRALNMKDHRDREGDVEWANSAHTFGVSRADSLVAELDAGPVTDTRPDPDSDDKVIASAAPGESKFATDY